MTWAEFLIRLHAYRRLDLKEWYKVREIAWSALVGSHYDPKKLPKNIERFIPLSDESKDDGADAMLKRMREVQEEYLKNKKNG
jgi:hypothetical protein